MSRGMCIAAAFVRRGRRARPEFEVLRGLRVTCMTSLWALKNSYTTFVVHRGALLVVETAEAVSGFADSTGSGSLLLAWQPRACEYSIAVPRGGACLLSYIHHAFELVVRHVRRRRALNIYAT